LSKKKHIPSNQLFEISFQQLEEKPMLILEELYQNLDIQDFEQARPKFEKYLKSVNHYKKNKHQINKNQLNELLTEWAFFMDVLNYTVPKTIEIVDV